MTAQLTTYEIAEPGVYDDVPEKAYLADPVVGGSLSSSGARTLVTRTPAHFDYGRKHGRPPRRAFDIGHGVHVGLLGTGAELVTIDADDYKTKAAREQRDAVYADGNTPLLPVEREQVAAMVAAVKAHPDAGPLFSRPAVAERTMVYRDEETGVMCRVRVDWTPTVPTGARPLVVDLKTSVSADPEDFASSMAKFGYHLQAAWYCDAFTQLGLDNGHDPLFLLVVVEKDPPHLVSIVEPDDEAMDYGMQLARRARHIYRDCTASGQWPGYQAPPGQVSTALALPSWLRRTYEADPYLSLTEDDDE